MLYAGQLIQQAAQDAKAPMYLAQGLVKLNLILEELCIKHGFAASRGVYFFSLSPGLITTVGGITNFGGPYKLPLDYLRTSESSGAEGVQNSFFYVYNGVPYSLLPWDLGKGDMQVQQPGIQNLPWAFYTDMATESTAADRIIGTATAKVTALDATIILSSPDPLVTAGLGMAGVGIAPGSVVLGVADAEVPLPPPSTDTVTMPGAAITLSLPATGTFAAASVMFGIPPSVYVYPGPSGAFPATLRYQRLMPRITDIDVVPWFPDQMYLLERLTAELMVTTDDERRMQALAVAERRLGKYEVYDGDKINRPERVILDRNTFGGNRWSDLPNTKSMGW